MHEPSFSRLNEIDKCTKEIQDNLHKEEITPNTLNQSFASLSEEFEKLLKPFQQLDVLFLHNLTQYMHTLAKYYCQVVQISPLLVDKNWQTIFYRQLLLSNRLSLLTTEEQRKFYIKAAEAHLLTGDYEESLAYACLAHSIEPATAMESLFIKVCEGLSVQALGEIKLCEINIDINLPLEKLFAAILEQRKSLDGLKQKQNFFLLTFYVRLYAKLFPRDDTAGKTAKNPINDFLLEYEQEIKNDNNLRQQNIDDIKNRLPAPLKSYLEFINLCCEHGEYLIASKCYEKLAFRYGDIKHLKQVLLSWSDAEVRNKSKALKTSLINITPSSNTHSTQVNELIAYWISANKRMIEARDNLTICLGNTSPNSKNDHNNNQTDINFHTSTIAIANYGNIVKELLNGLLTHIVSLFGQPPCSFSLCAFGSLVRQEFGPYSDLDIFLLIKEQDFRTDLYFRQVLWLFNQLLRSLDRSCVLSAKNKAWINSGWHWLGMQIDEKNFNFNREDWHGVPEEYIQTPKVFAKWVVNTVPLFTKANKEKPANKPIRGLYAAIELYTNNPGDRLFHDYEEALQQDMENSLKVINDDNNNNPTQNYRTWAKKHWKDMEALNYGWRENQGDIFNIKDGYLKPLSEIAWNLGLLWLENFETKLLASPQDLMQKLVDDKHYLSESYRHNWQQAWEVGVHWRAYYQLKRKDHKEKVRLPTKISYWPGEGHIEGQSKEIQDEIDTNLPLADLQMVQDLHRYLALVIESTLGLKNIDIASLPKEPIDFIQLYRKQCEEELKHYYPIREKSLVKNKSPINTECLDIVLDPSEVPHQKQNNQANPSNTNNNSNNNQANEKANHKEETLKLRLLLTQKINHLFYTNAAAEEGAIAYVKLPENLWPIFIEQLQELRILYPTSVHELAERLSALEKYLATIPTMHGTQLAYRQQQAAWLQTIRAFSSVNNDNNIEPLFAADTVQHQVKIQCMNQVYLPEQNRYVYQTEPAGLLLDAIVEQLFDNEGFPKLPPIEDKEDGRRLTLPIRDIKRNIIAFVKFYPALPGIQATIDAVTRRISGVSLCASVAKITHPKQKIVYPVLISRYAGLTIRKQLNRGQHSQNLEQRLDPTLAQLQMLETLGLHFGDEKDDNLVEISWPTPTGAKKVLLSIDGDCALLPFLIKGESDSAIKLLVASWRLCQSLVREPLDRLAMYRFAALLLDKLFESALEEMQSFEEAISGETGLFKNEEIHYFLRELGNNTIMQGILNFIGNKTHEEFSCLRLGYVPGTVVEAYARLEKLQQFLYLDNNELSPETKWPPHMLAYGHLYQPFLTTYYESLPVNITTEERFNRLPFEHVLIKEPRSQRMVHQSLFKHQQYSLATVLVEYSDAYQALLEGKVNGATQELNELKRTILMTKSLEDTNEFLLDQIAKPDAIKNIATWKKMPWLEDFFRKCKWEKISSEAQALLFLGLTGSVFTSLYLVDTTITDQELKGLLKGERSSWKLINKKRNNTFGNLRVLDISNCRQLTMKGLNEDLELLYLPVLEKLVTDDLLPKSSDTLDWRQKRNKPVFIKLIHLELKNNSFLKNFYFDAPNLKYLFLSGNQQLMDLELNCPHLKYIDLTNCHAMTPKALSRALQFCTNIHTFAGELIPPLIDIYGITATSLNMLDMLNIIIKEKGNLYTITNKGQCVLPLLLEMSRQFGAEYNLTLLNAWSTFFDLLLQPYSLHLIPGVDLKPIVAEDLQSFFNKREALFTQWLFEHRISLKPINNIVYENLDKLEIFIKPLLEQNHSLIDLNKLNKKAKSTLFILLKLIMANTSSLSLTTFNYAGCELFPEDISITTLLQKSPNLREVFLMYGKDHLLNRNPKYYLYNFVLQNLTLVCPHLERLNIINCNQIETIILNSPNLAELDLTGCENIEIYQIHSKYLRRCKLSGNKLDDKKLDQIIPWLALSTQLEELDLSNNPLADTDACINLLLAIIDHVPSLRKIELLQTQLSLEQQIHIHQALLISSITAKLQQLAQTQQITLDLRACNISDQHIFALQKALILMPLPLQIIDLSDNSLTDVCIKPLGEIIAQIPSLQKVLLEEVHIASMKKFYIEAALEPQLLTRKLYTGTKFLDWDNYGINDRTIIALQQKLEKMPSSLERINLSNNPLTGSCIEPLLSIINNIPTLQDISLEGITQISTEQRNGIHQAVSLQFVTLELQRLAQTKQTTLDWHTRNINNHIIFALQQGLKLTPLPLQTIDLSNNPLTDDCIEPLLEIIKYVPTLQYISLKRTTQIRSKQKNRIRQAWLPRLISVELQQLLQKQQFVLDWQARDRHIIDDQLIFALQQALKTTPIPLQTLNLSNNPLTNDCIEPLLEIINDIPTLQNILLEGVTQISLQQRARMRRNLQSQHRFVRAELQRLTQTQQFVLDWCRSANHFIDDETIVILQEALKITPLPLEVINLTNNPLIKDCADSLLAIIAKTPSLYEVSLLSTNIPEHQKHRIYQALWPRPLINELEQLTRKQKTELNWSKNASDNTINTLLQALSIAPQPLRSINLSHTSLTDACVENLLKIIAKIKTLNLIILVNTKINPINQKRIACWLAINEKMNSLSQENNNDIQLDCSDPSLLHWHIEYLIAIFSLRNTTFITNIILPAQAITAEEKFLHLLQVIHWHNFPISFNFIPTSCAENNNSSQQVLLPLMYQQFQHQIEQSAFHLLQLCRILWQPTQLGSGFWQLSIDLVSNILLSTKNEFACLSKTQIRKIVTLAGDRNTLGQLTRQQFLQETNCYRLNQLPTLWSNEVNNMLPNDEAEIPIANAKHFY